MDIQFYTLLKVDNTENTVSLEHFANAQNIKDYIWDLITNCVDNEGDREYIFDKLKIWFAEFMEKYYKEFTGKITIFEFDWDSVFFHSQS